MSTIPADYKYSSEHEWVSPAADGVVSLATGGTNEIIELIYSATYLTPWSKGYSYGMAMSWVYTIIIALILLVVFLLLRDKSDKKVKYEKRLVTLR